MTHTMEELLATKEPGKMPKEDLDQIIKEHDIFLKKHIDSRIQEVLIDRAAPIMGQFRLQKEGHSEHLKPYLERVAKRASDSLPPIVPDPTYDPLGPAIHILKPPYTEFGSTPTTAESTPVVPIGHDWNLKATYSQADYENGELLIGAGIGHLEPGSLPDAAGADYPATSLWRSINGEVLGESSSASATIMKIWQFPEGAGPAKTTVQVTVDVPGPPPLSPFDLRVAPTGGEDGLVGVLGELVVSVYGSGISMQNPRTATHTFLWKQESRSVPEMGIFASGQLPIQVPLGVIFNPGLLCIGVSGYLCVMRSGNTGSGASPDEAPSGWAGADFSEKVGISYEPFPGIHVPLTPILGKPVSVPCMEVHTKWSLSNFDVMVS